MRVFGPWCVIYSKDKRTWMRWIANFTWLIIGRLFVVNSTQLISFSIIRRPKHRQEATKGKQTMTTTTIPPIPMTAVSTAGGGGGRNLMSGKSIGLMAPIFCLVEEGRLFTFTTAMAVNHCFGLPVQAVPIQFSPCAMWVWVWDLPVILIQLILMLM